MFRTEQNRTAVGVYGKTNRHIKGRFGAFTTVMIQVEVFCVTTQKTSTLREYNKVEKEYLNCILCTVRAEWNFFNPEAPDSPKKEVDVAS